ncbi:hypothetical protein KEJ39_03680, partial [Candidatus Bathyarchaeota archaeon]|nr:hypothetical protein [Candidatus Bathyarchaeota archaeon]
EVLDEWGDGFKESARAVYLEKPTSHTMAYKKQFLLTLITPKATAQGFGWYDKGSSAVISLSPASIPMEGIMGFLGGKEIFDHWEGDIYSTEASTRVPMESPKRIEAKWRCDYTNPLLVMLLGVTGIGLIVIGSSWSQGRIGRKGRPAIAVPMRIKKSTTLIPAKPTITVEGLAENATLTEFELLLEEYGKIRQKVRKLTDSYVTGVVSEGTYKALLEDYEKRSLDLQRMIDEVEHQINAELRRLQEEETKIQKEIELLNAKQIIGDIQPTEYASEKATLDAKFAGVTTRRDILFTQTEKLRKSRCKFCGVPLNGQRLACPNCGKAQE